jgi:phosphoglycerate kinase
LANDFLKAKGYEVGRSLVSDIGDAKDMLKNSKVILPADVTVLGVDGRDVKVPNEVLSTEIIYDVGPMTIAHLGPLVSKAKTILWNGPLGNFEHGFREMTEALARMVANSAGDSVVGGGDTIAAIQRLKIENEFSFTSTAGGAMLDFLAHGTLPGIEALEKSRKIN